MLVPPPPPAYTLSPALEDLDDITLEVIERCVSALTGHVGAVVVVSVGVTDHHVVIELATAVGPIMLLELMDARPLPLGDADLDY